MTKAMKSGADVVLTTFGPELTQQFTQTAIQLGAKFRIATVAESFTDDIIAKLGADKTIVNTALLTSPYPPVTATDIAGVKQFNDELDIAEKQYSDLKASNRPHIFNSWMAGYVFGQIAGSITGDVTKESVTAALESAKDVDTLGVMPPWTPAAPGAILSRVNNTTAWFIKVENGKQALDGTEPVETLAKVGS